MRRSFIITGILACFLLGVTLVTQGSGIVPAIVPALVPAANKTSTTSTVFALASSSALTASSPVCTNANGDMTTTACTTNAVTSTSPVTVSANSVVDQQLMELSLTAGYLNSLGRPFDFFGAGVYTTQAGQTPTLEFKIKLCTVSGCGSGTVVSLVDITTTATTANSPNVSWNLRTVGTTNATGATGNLEVHGNLTADLGNLISASDTIFTDTNTAVSSNIDLTAALFVDFTVKFSTQPGTPFNACTQREGVVSPGGSTSGGGGSGAVTFISTQNFSGGNSVTFSSISGAYTHLNMKCLARGAAAVNNETLDFQFNADTGANYNRQFLSVQGGSVSSGTQSGVTSILTSVIPGANQTASYGGVANYDIPYYANTNFFKNVMILNNTPPAGATGTGEFVVGGTWANTAAITSIKVFIDSGNNAAANSTCSLYGIT